MTLEAISDLEKSVEEASKRYAKQGIIFGSAPYTDFSLACDQLLDYFEKGVSVEESLHLCACEGYDLSLFDYELTDEEKKKANENLGYEGYTI